MKTEILLFIRKHKAQCEEAFVTSPYEKVAKQGRPFIGEWRTIRGKKLVDLARIELKYSPKTYSRDIFTSLWKAYKQLYS